MVGGGKLVVAISKMSLGSNQTQKLSLETRAGRRRVCCRPHSAACEDALYAGCICGEMSSDTGVRGMLWCAGSSSYARNVTRLFAYAAAKPRYNDPQLFQCTDLRVAQPGTFPL